MRNIRLFENFDTSGTQEIFVYLPGVEPRRRKNLLLQQANKNNYAVEPLEFGPYGSTYKVEIAGPDACIEYVLKQPEDFAVIFYESEFKIDGLVWYPHKFSWDGKRVLVTLGRTDDRQAEKMLVKSAEELYEML